MTTGNRTRSRAGVLAGAMAMILAAAAQAQDLNFDIPAGDLVAALDAYSKQTGQQLVYLEKNLEGKKSPGAHGAMSPEQALEALLAGTGLKINKDSSGALAIFPPEAVAGAASTGEAGELEEVVVRATAISQLVLISRSATRLDSDPMLVPLSISTVKSDLLREQQVQDLGDVLDNVAGMTVRDGFIFSRGFDVKTARNGTANTVASTFGGLGLTPVIATDRVEVVKGPEQVLQGKGGGIGGVVNIVTKTPTPVAYALVGGSVGSDGYWRIDLDVNGTLVEGKYGTLMGEVIGSTSQQNTGPHGIATPSMDYYSGLLRWTNADLGSDLTVAYQDTSTEDGPGLMVVGGNPLRSGAPEYLLGDRKSHSKSSGDLLEVHFTQRIVGSWHAEVTYLDEESESDDNYFSVHGSYGDPAVLQADQVSSYGDRSKTETFRINLNGEFATGPVTHKVLLGYDDQVVTSPAGGGETSLGTYYTEIPSGVQTFEPCEDWCAYENTSNFEETQTGILFVDQANWQRWHALIGVRWLQADFKYKDSGFVLFDYSESKTLPQYGLVYAANDLLSIYASGSEGYAASHEMFDANGNPIPDMSYNQFEGGVKYLLMGEQLALTAAIYEIRQRDVPNYIGETPGHKPIYESIPGITSKGVDLELAGQPLPGLAIRATYAYLKATVDATGQPRPGGYPPNKFTLWSQYWFSREVGRGFWAGGGLSAVDAPERPAGAGEWGGNAIVDLSAGYQDAHWQAILGVKNVGDSEGYESMGLGPIPLSNYYSATRVAERGYRLDLYYRF